MGERPSRERKARDRDKETEKKTDRQSARDRRGEVRKR
jgi:hypothetical protein